MATQTPRSTRKPWIIAGVLGSLVACLLLVMISGAGYFPFASQTSPLAQKPAAETRAQSPAAPTAAPTFLKATATTALATQTATQARLVLSEDFGSNANDWNIADQTYTDEYGTFNESIGGGKFRLEVKAIQGFFTKYRPLIVEKTCSASGVCASYANMHLTVDAKRISGPEDTALYGIVFQMDDDGNYYLFKVGDDQQWKVLLRYQDAWITLIDWAQSAAIRPGEVNRLEVTATGSHFVFAINNQQVGAVDDTQISDGYKVGVGVEMDPGTEAVFEFSKVTLGVLDTGAAATSEPTATTPVTFGGGGKIAFVSRRDGTSQIYVADADGSSQTRLTHDSFVNYGPTWSPDGKRIAFASERDSISQIYLMNADGSGVTPLTHDSFSNYDPAWSPDGKHIAFTAEQIIDTWQSGEIKAVCVIDVDGSGRTQLTDFAFNWGPAWSPDGSKIAYTHGYSSREPPLIYVMNGDGSGKAAITNYESFNWKPVWSPDGKRLAFSSIRDGGLQNIYVMNADGSAQTRLTNSSPNDEPTWSPDGKRIAYSHGDQWDKRAIYVMNADGRSQVRASSEDDFSPAWQPSEK